MQTPSPYTEFGIKGIGEGGAVGPPAAIVSAVNDALRPIGAEVHDLPLTPQRVLAAILRAVVLAAVRTHNQRTPVFFQPTIRIASFAGLTG